MDIPWARVDARAAAAGDVARRPGARRSAGPAAVGDDESGARRQAVRGLGPHVSRSCSRSSTPASRCRASRCRLGSRRRSTVERSRRRVAERRRHPARHRSAAARANTSSSPRTWITSASASRSTATASTTARWTTRRASRRSSRWPRAARGGREAGAIDPLRRGHRRGERAARLALLRRAPDRAPAPASSPT